MSTWAQVVSEMLAGGKITPDHMQAMLRVVAGEYVGQPLAAGMAVGESGDQDVHLQDQQRQQSETS